MLDYSYGEPTYGYRSDSRLAAGSNYGTYPGKSHIVKRLNNESDYPLLQSTANAFEMDWQPPINPALLPPPSPRRFSPIRGSPPLRQVRASSPQKGILKCRASPISLNLNGRAPNLFDCPGSSSSNLAIIDGSNNALNKTIFDNNNNISNNSRFNENKFGNEFGATIQNGISQKQIHPISTDVQPLRSKTRLTKYEQFMIVLRTITVEFFAIIFTIFLHYHIQFVLRDSQLFSLIASNENNYFGIFTIAILAVIDAAPIFALFTVLPIVHLNPAITIAHLFSGVIPIHVCLAFLVTQLCASIICALLLFVYLTYDVRSNAEAPSLTTGGRNVGGGNYVREAYQMVFNQFLGTLLIVVCHIRLSRNLWSKPFLTTSTLSLLNRLELNEAKNFVAIFGAFWICSFLSLLRSNVSWNPLTAFTILIEHSTKNLLNGMGIWDSLAIWRNHYVFWMGPMLGALFGCFLCRIAPTLDGKESNTLEQQKF